MNILDLLFKIEETLSETPTDMAIRGVETSLARKRIEDIITGINDGTLAVGYANVIDIGSDRAVIAVEITHPDKVISQTTGLSLLTDMLHSINNQTSTMAFQQRATIEGDNMLLFLCRGIPAFTPAPEHTTQH